MQIILHFTYYKFDLAKRYVLSLKTKSLIEPEIRGFKKNRSTVRSEILR